MEEGRRMFQIFAARMFEQRVLTAYREKVASERQQKLIEELEEESRLDTQREAKRAKEAQKKKDKKRQQKQLRDEEKAKREAEKAAEDAEAKALVERKAEEQRQKKEEQRKKKEAEKKAQDEERQQKEAEKQKRLQEAREHQAELERKQREQKERDKKKRIEAKRREREEREAKEIEAQQEKAREAAERKENEAKAKNDRETKERSRKEAQEFKQQQGHAAPFPTKQVVPLSIVPTPSTLHPPQTGSTHASPHLHIATPVVPKAPTPIRPRKASFQGSQNSSPKISQVPSGSSATSPSITSLPQNGMNIVAAKPLGQPSFQHPATISAVPPLNTSPGMISQPPGFSGVPVVGSSFSPSQGAMLPPMAPRTTMPEPIMHAQIPQHPHQQQFNFNHFRGFAHSNGMPFPPGINGMRPLPHGRGALDMSSQVPPLSNNVGNINVGQYMSQNTMPTHSHSRHTSASFASFDVPDIPTQTQPIARPTPIQRPSSVAPNQHSGNNTSNNASVDDLSNHLGSSALLDDTDVPLSSNPNSVRRGSIAPGVPLTTRHGFNPGGGKMDPFLRGMPSSNGHNWSSQQMPFGPSGVSSPPPWSPTPGKQLHSAYSYPPTVDTSINMTQDGLILESLGVPIVQVLLVL